ncbi:MAG TPA: glycosyltransferase 87 family protein [Actinomycetota bacterium]|nr:glycosyltransferase 87 family protein [Actinomycetota bacterium]
MSSPSSRRPAAALGASVASFVVVATVAATPGSPFTPILPAGGGPAGPFRWVSELVGLDALEGSALVAVGVAAVAAAAGAFAFVLRQAWLGAIPIRAVVVLAVVYHVALLSLPLLFSRDVYSYAYYGKIAAIYHANPYVATPADFPSDELAAFVGPRWVDTPAVYGPVWTQISSLVVRLVDGVAAMILAFRVLAVAASLGVVAVVARVVGRLRPERSAFAIALVGVNPVVLFQSAGSGHNDLLVAFAVVGAFALLVARRPFAATAALALGTLVKATAAVPLLLFVVADVASRRRGERLPAALRHVGVAAGLAVVAAAPFLTTRDPSLGMLELATHEGWLAPSRFFRRLLDAVSGDVLGFVPRIVFPLLLVGVVLVLVRALVRRAPVSSGTHGASWGWGLLAVMLLGPVLLPWYVTWVLPLVWLLPFVPRTTAIATGMALTVSQWTSEPARFATAYDVNILFGHYVVTPVVTGLLVWLLVDLRRRVRSGLQLEDAPHHVSAAAGDR